MNSKYIQLTACVGEQIIRAQASPVPRVLRKGINYFAKNVCTLCEILIQTEMAESQEAKEQYSVDYYIICEDANLGRGTYTIEGSDRMIIDAVFEHTSFTNQLKIADMISAYVICTNTFCNQP